MTHARRDEAGIQRRYFEAADAERYAWTTRAPGFAELEDALLVPLLTGLEEPCLEIGCGEGNNLLRLSRDLRCVGVDLFGRKLRFAARELPAVPLVNADAERLPFADACFGSVFIRDLLHHLPSPTRTLGEAVRVLRPGGRLCLVEPNGRNPLVLLQTLLVPAEISARGFRAERIHAWLEPLPLDEIRIEMRHALPLRRVLLHYRFGWPALGRWAPARALLRWLESAAARLLPVSRWSYIVATARRRAGLSVADRESSP